MGYRIDLEKMNEILENMSRDYHVFAPKWDGRKRKVRYGEIKSISEIVLDRQSDFSPKEAYYPINNDRNNNLYQQYAELAKNDSKVIFGGRLGQYKYYDMDKVILSALECVKAELN